MSKLTQTKRKSAAAAMAWLSVVAVASACGSKSHHSAASAPRATVTSTGGSTPAGGTAGTSSANQTASFQCATKKTPAQFVASLTADLQWGPPSTADTAAAADPSFNYSNFVASAVQDSRFLSLTVPAFTSNLLKIAENLPMPTAKKNDPNADALYEDLKGEAVAFVSGHINDPWPNMFTTQQYYCTANTGPLYNYPVDPNLTGYVACDISKTQPQRAGIQGLISVLQSFPADMYNPNDTNNFKRNRMLVYLAQAIELFAATNGPKGTGKPKPMPECVPQIDTRVSDTGLVFGSLSVAESGPVCATCHSTYHGPMVGCFLQFDIDGSVLDPSKIDTLQSTDTGGISNDVVKDILENSATSCWDPSGTGAPPQIYTGMPGCGRLIANSPTLGKALAKQIALDLTNNTAPDPSALQASEDYYNKNGTTFRSAIQGYFTSDWYECASPAAPGQ